MALKKESVPSTPSDFRPISLLCFLYKMLEKLVLDQIVDFLVEGSLLATLQTGFQKLHGTQTSLLNLTEDIRMGIDKKMVTFLLMLDFSKASQTISPSKLLVKLRSIGFSRAAFLWIKSYLQDQSQCVAFKTNSSEHLRISESHRSLFWVPCCSVSMSMTLKTNLTSTAYFTFFTPTICRVVICPGADRLTYKSQLGLNNEALN